MFPASPYNQLYKSPLSTGLYESSVHVASSKPVPVSASEVWHVCCDVKRSDTSIWLCAGGQSGNVAPVRGCIGYVEQVSRIVELLLWLHNEP